jgi:hypothetical protein
MKRTIKVGVLVLDLSKKKGECEARDCQPLRIVARWTVPHAGIRISDSTVGIVHI